MHANSLEAFDSLDTAGRRAVVLAVYVASRIPLTDRECGEALGLTDLNGCKPRISEMVKAGVLVEVGKVKDQATKKSVRMCTNARIF